MIVESAAASQTPTAPQIDEYAYTWYMYLYKRIRLRRAVFLGPVGKWKYMMLSLHGEIFANVISETLKCRFPGMRRRDAMTSQNDDTGQVVDIAHVTCLHASTFAQNRSTDSFRDVSNASCGFLPINPLRTSFQEVNEGKWNLSI